LKERDEKEPKRLHAIGACEAAFGQIQQSTLLIGEYTAGCLAIALPRLIMARRRFGNLFTLQKILLFCQPKCGKDDAGTGGDI